MNRPVYLPEINKVTVHDPAQTGPTMHYVTSDTGEKPPFEPRVSDEAYREALGGIVIKCVDVVVVDPNTAEVLVAKRVHEPMAGKWVFGGRKRAGESNLQTAIVNMGREFPSLAVDQENLIQTPHEFDMVWDTREQGPTRNRQGETVSGCHMISSVYALKADKETLDLTTHDDEFGELSWEPIDTILNSEPGEYHPAYIDMVHDALDVLTTPEAAATVDEAVDRAETGLAYLRMVQRQRNTELGKLGSLAGQLAEQRRDSK